MKLLQDTTETDAGTAVLLILMIGERVAVKGRVASMPPTSKRDVPMMKGH